MKAHHLIAHFLILLTLISCVEKGHEKLKLRHLEKEFPLNSKESIQRIEKKYFRSQLSILQNITTSDETIITLLQNKGLNLRYLVFSSQGDSKELSPDKIQDVHPEFNIIHLLLQKLIPDVDYFLVVLDSENYIVDTRRFSVFSETKKSLRVAIASCARVGWMGGDYGPLSIWNELEFTAPDALFFLGDWVYPDNLFQALFYLKPSLAEIKNRYVESWLSLQIFRQSKLIPTFSILDDHDYGFQGANRRNNLDRQHLMFEYFRSFFPIFETNTSAFTKGPGGSFWIQFFKFNLFMLDNKYYRTASGPDGIEGLIWGPEQLQWVAEILEKNPQPSFIGSGTLMTFPIFNQDAAQYESPEEFKELLRSLKASSEKLILLSGDVHYSDVKKLPFEMLHRESYEITSSRIHSINPMIIPPFISGYVGPEKGQLIHSSDKNFVTLDIPEDGVFKDIKVEIHNKNSKVFLTTQIFQSR